MFYLFSCIALFANAQTTYTVRDVEQVIIYRHLDIVCPGDSCWRGDTLNLMGRRVYLVKGDTNYRFILGKEKAQWLLKWFTTKSNYQKGEVDTPVVNYTLLFYDKNDTLIIGVQFGFDLVRGSTKNGITIPVGMPSNRKVTKLEQFFSTNKITRWVTPCRHCKQK